MLKLHYLNDSRAIRILWLLEELELDYEMVTYKRNSKTKLAPESLKKIHPLGKSPVVTDANRVFAESAVIIDSLAEQYRGEQGRPQLIPQQDEDARFQYRYWLHYAEGSLMPFLVMGVVFDTAKSAPMPFFVRPIAKEIFRQIAKAYLKPNVRTHLDYIEQHLQTNRYFAGEAFSGADIQMAYPLFSIQENSHELENYPAISRYLEQLKARPAYQRAIAKDRANS